MPAREPTRGATIVVRLVRLWHPEPRRRRDGPLPAVRHRSQVISCATGQDRPKRVVVLEPCARQLAERDGLRERQTEIPKFAGRHG
jgi:hypothetical protein